VSRKPLPAIIAMDGGQNADFARSKNLPCKNSITPVEIPARIAEENRGNIQTVAYAIQL
jgi:hypothetical protein